MSEYTQEFELVWKSKSGPLTSQSRKETGFIIYKRLMVQHKQSLFLLNEVMHSANIYDYKLREMIALHLKTNESEESPKKG